MMGQLKFNATSGTQVVTTNGVEMGMRYFTLNCSGGTVQLADDFYHKSSGYCDIRKSAGTFDPNGKEYKAYSS